MEPSNMTKLNLGKKLQALAKPSEDQGPRAHLDYDLAEDLEPGLPTCGSHIPSLQTGVHLMVNVSGFKLLKFRILSNDARTHRQAVPPALPIVLELQMYTTIPGSYCNVIVLKYNVPLEINLSFNNVQYDKSFFEFYIVQMAGHKSKR